MIKAIVQEDAEVVGLSFLCGGHMEIMQRFMARPLQENGLDHVLVVIGGIIQPWEIPQLKEMGVAEIFSPGSSLSEIAKFVLQNVGRHESG